jgi:hypothetical protein
VLTVDDVLGWGLVQTLVNNLTIIVAITAIAAAEIRDRRSRRAKSPRWTTWAVKGWSLYRTSDQRRDPPEHPWLATATITRLAFWNAGFDTIQSSDVSPTAPFRIVGTDSTNLLDVKLIRTNAADAEIRLRTGAIGEWFLDFTYLRPGIGGLFVAYHSGTSPLDVAVVGELITGSALERVDFPLFGLHGIFPKPVRLLIGDRWAHRISALSELLIPLYAIHLLYPDIFSSHETGFMRVLEVVFFLWTLIGQLIIAWFFLKGWRQTVPASLRPFDLSDSP